MDEVTLETKEKRHFCAVCMWEEVKVTHSHVRGQVTDKSLTDAYVTSS